MPMKSKVTFSRFTTAITVIIFVAFYIGCISSIHNKPDFFILLSIYVLLIACAVLFGAAYIEADADYIVMGSILRRRKIPICNVASVELFKPTMGAIRIFASGGFMGYWGFFIENDIGRYYAFYGKASDCFLIRMKDGAKYVLGCNQPHKMVEYIQSQLQKS